MADPDEERSRFRQSLSRRIDNPEGLLERELKEREQNEIIPGFNYKKRKLNDLSSKEVEDILYCYLTEPLTQEDVARKFRVKPLLISKLYRWHKDNPEKLREKKMREKKKEQKQDLIKQTTK